jgi:hypothetical protein
VENDYEPLIRKVGDAAQNEQQVREELSFERRTLPNDPNL